MDTSFLLEKSWSFHLGLIFAVLATRAFIVAGGSVLWTRFSKWARAHQIVDGEILPKKLLIEILNGLKILFVDAVFAVILMRFGIFHFVKPEGWGSFLLVFAMFFVWVEVYFYYSHRLFHLPQFFWIHRHHHQSGLINPWTSLSFSIVERLILLFGVTLIPAVISFWFPFSYEVLISYFFLNYLLNVYGHLNVETLPEGFVHTKAGQYINTTTYHALHHMRYRGHFGLFTSFLDRLHGTKFSDYEVIHAKNYNKHEVSPMAGIQQ